MPAEAVRIVGLRELSLKFKAFDGAVSKQLSLELKEAAEPVRAAAEHLAVAGITNIGDRWSQMRVGVTQQLVYVAPKTRRRRGSKRPNLAPLLLTKALEPALEENEPVILARAEAAIQKAKAEAGL